MSDCLEVLYELPLQPNNTASETFLHNWQRCEELTGYLSWGVGRLGEYVTLNKTFYSLLYKQQIATAIVTSTCSSLFHSIEEAFIGNIIIVLCINYKI